MNGGGGEMVGRGFAIFAVLCDLCQVPQWSQSSVSLVVMPSILNLCGGQGFQSSLVANDESRSFDAD